MYGCMWHVVVGENFTANITAEVNFMEIYVDTLLIQAFIAKGKLFSVHDLWIIFHLPLEMRNTAP